MIIKVQVSLIKKNLQNTIDDFEKFKVFVENYVEHNFFSFKHIEGDYMSNNSFKNLHVDKQNKHNQPCASYSIGVVKCESLYCLNSLANYH